MLFPDHFLAVRATVEAGREDEFNRWYDEEHVADAVSMFPGCLGGARYKVVDGDGTHQYIALYAFGSAAELTAAISGPEIKELARRYDQAIGSFSTRGRTTYTKVFQMDRQASGQRAQAS
jgi:antibiotic biosynthesis monooxygenase (ABM) superfamily enzyme